MDNRTKSELLKDLEILFKKNQLLEKKIENNSKQNSAESEKSDKLFNLIFENSQLGIALFDDSGKMLLSNKVFSTLLERSSHKSSKINLQDLLGNITRTKGSESFKNLFTKKKNNFETEKKFESKTGKSIWAKLSVSLIRDSKLKTTYYLVFLEDITRHKKLIDKLATEEGLLRTLMQNIPDSIYFKDLKSRFIKVNNNKARRHGFKNPDNLIGKTDFDLFDTDHANEALSDEQQIIQTGKPIIAKEEKIVNKNGNVNWVSTTKVPLYNDNREIIGTFGITRDITSKKEFSIILNESEERYRTLFETSSDGIFLLTDKFIDCNKSALAMFKCTREDIIDHSPSELSPQFQPDGKSSRVSSMEKIKAALSGIPQSFYWQHKRKDNSLLDVEVNLNKLTINNKHLLQATLRDISERVSAEKIQNAIFNISEASNVVEDIENLYKRIHEIISHLMSAKNFYIALYNEKSDMVTFPYFVDEYDPPQAPKKLGKGLTEYVLRKGEAILVDAKKDLELRESGEVELIGAPQAIWLGIPLKLAGKTVGVMVVQDYENEATFGEKEKNLLIFVSEQITQAILRKKNSEAIKKYAEELQQLNRTKDKFFSILAHDLRNPFITILGFSDLLLSDYNDLSDDERLFYVEEMKKSAEISHNLLQNLLQWSRSQTGRIEFNPTNINLNKIINDNLALGKVLAVKKQINLFAEIPDNTSAWADEDMITTVIRNLLTNALKFTNKNGEVKITVNVSDQIVETTICDNGIGMDIETKSKLFRLDVSHTQPGTENEAGTGLGLILCKEFIEKNNGTLTVESEFGKGSKFTFALPRNN